MNIGSLLNRNTSTSTPTSISKPEPRRVLPIALVLNPTEEEHQFNTETESSLPTSPNLSDLSASVIHSAPSTPDYVRLGKSLTDLQLPPPAHNDDEMMDEEEDDDYDNDGATAKKRELRMVGQRHRDKEKTLIDQLYDAIEMLQRENHRLFKLSVEALTKPYGVSVNHFRSMLKVEVHAIHGTHRVSDLTAAKLGVRYLSGAMALLLLETVASRRNLTNAKMGRQRNCDLVCARSGVFDSIIAAGVTRLRNEAMLPVSEALAIIGEVHLMWSKSEALCEEEDVKLSCHVSSIFNSNRRHMRSTLRGISKPGKICGRCGTGHCRMGRCLVQCRRSNGLYNEEDMMDVVDNQPLPNNTTSRLACF